MGGEDKGGGLVVGDVGTGDACSSGEAAGLGCGSAGLQSGQGDTQLVQRSLRICKYGCHRILPLLHVDSRGKARHVQTKPAL